MNEPADPLPRNAGPVRLRRLRASDLPLFHSYRSDAQVGRYQGWLPMTEAEARVFIDAMATAELFVPGKWVQLAIADASTDQLVGDMGILVGERGESAEIGFTLSLTATGKGFATAASRDAVLFLFECTRVRRVIGVTDARNARSVEVLERAGMSHIESRHVVFRGEPCTELVYARER